MFRLLSMRRLGILLVSLGWAIPASATPALVHRTSAFDTSGAAFNVTIPSTTSGNTIIVRLGWFHAACTGSMSAPTDNKGGGSSTYNTDLTPVNPQSSSCVAAYSTLNIASGITQVTINDVGANTYVGVFIDEWSGLQTSGAFDKQQSSANSSTTSWTSGTTATLTGSSDLALGFFFNQSNNTSTITPTNGFGTAATVTEGVLCGCSFYSEQQILASNAALAATATLSNAVTGAGAIVTYQAAVAPTITSLNSATFTLGVNNTFTVTASGSPTITFSEIGSLPNAVTLSSAGLLSGIPAGGTAGTYPITITATNGINPNATQSFTLTVSQAAYSTGQLISAPMLPQVVPRSTYPSESTYTITPLASGGNLQTALTAATCGTIISLAHGGSYSASTQYTGPLTNCACHTDPTQYVIVRSDAFVGGSVRGVRVDPSIEDVNNLAHISSTDPNYAFAFNTANNSCYWFLGVDVVNTTDGAIADFSFGDGSLAPAFFPHDFILDHVYCHGVATKGLRRCATLNGNFMTVIDSYISDCHQTGVDANGLITWDGYGGLLIQNNFIEGAAENFLTGGAASQAGVFPADLTFTGNHLFKPLSWRLGDPTYAGLSWNIKNLFEIKLWQRALVTKNVMENNWAANQGGTAFLINSGASGGDPLGWLQDLTAFNNIVRHAAQAFSLGANVDPIIQPIHRVSLHDNLWYDMDPFFWGTANSGKGPQVLVTGKSGVVLFAPFDVFLNHETISANNSGTSEGVSFNSNANVDLHYGFNFTNSIIPRGSNGAFQGNGGTSGDTVIAAFAPNLNAINDCIYGPSIGETYNNAAFNGKQLVTSGISGVFVMPGSNFHVAASSACHLASSDVPAIDIGANIDQVNSATAGVVQTLGCPVTLTNVSPSTFTHLGSTSITLTGTCFLNESGLGVIVGGSGPTSAISTISCAVNTCNVVMSAAISLQVNDTIGVTGTDTPSLFQGTFTVSGVTDTTHFAFTYTGIGTQSANGGTANRYSPGNACTSVSVVSSTSITCNTPAASGAVLTGPVSVFVSQWGIPVQSTVFGTYN